MYKENELLNISLLIPTALPANIYCMSGLAHVDGTGPCLARWERRSPEPPRSPALGGDCCSGREVGLRRAVAPRDSEDI